jgi:hypothetical protein
MSVVILELDSTPPSKKWSSERLLIGFAAFWLAGVSCGIFSLVRYSLAAGPQTQASMRWPAELGLSRVRGRPTLVMFVHPRCACSRASLSELAVLAANCPNAISSDVVFADPPGLVQRLQATDLWQSAQEIPDCTLIRDHDGAMARTLGAQTSGQVFLYDADGLLRFSGGITDSRGHAGSNAGRLAIEAIIRNETPATHLTPVFGCRLW